MLNKAEKALKILLPRVTMAYISQSFYPKKNKEMRQKNYLWQTQYVKNNKFPQAWKLYTSVAGGAGGIWNVYENPAHFC